MQWIGINWMENNYGKNKMEEEEIEVENWLNEKDDFT